MFTVKVETEGAAFRDFFTGEENDIAEAAEIRSILAKVVRSLENGAKSGICMDSNGNKVGWWMR